MCNRYVLNKEHLREILERLGIGAELDYATRYNIAPSTLVPAVRKQSGASSAEAIKLRWGLVPAWAKEDIGTTLLNARAETIAAKPSFRSAFRARRCVIPASGYYEWQAIGRTRKPWLFRRRDEQPFCFAGLWESWRRPDGTPLETCTIITVEPNDLARPIHTRMPVILAPEQCAPWIDPQSSDPEKISAFLRPFPAEAMTALAVSTHVSNVRHEGPECLAPARADPPSDDAADTPQLSLGF
jgi:putative SOS response-associated peptidase YedK